MEEKNGRELIHVEELVMSNSLIIKSTELKESREIPGRRLGVLFWSNPPLDTGITMLTSARSGQRFVMRFTWEEELEEG